MYQINSKYIKVISFALQFDENGVLENTLCAIDALSYRSGSPSKQYLDSHFLRDLNKAFVGFSAKVKKSSAMTRHQSQEPKHSYSGTEFSCNGPVDLLRVDSEEYITASEGEDGNSDVVNCASGSHL